MRMCTHTQIYEKHLINSYKKYTQVSVTSKRALKNVVRNPATSIGQVVVNIVIGVIIGCIFFGLDQQEDINRYVVLMPVHTRTHYMILMRNISSDSEYVYACGVL